MKVILSISGGGKTKELVKNAVEYSSEGKLVHLITDEIAAFKHFAEKESNFNSTLVTYESVNGIEEIMIPLLFNKGHDVILIDVIPQLNERMDEFLNSVEKVLKVSFKEIYVTVQVPFESPLLNGEKLIILDYADYINKLK